ncbi:MAG: hypothetical protein QXU11_10000 [Thermoproteota archaeon]
MESREIEERIEKPPKSAEYEELTKELEEESAGYGPIEELDVLEEGFGELMGKEESLEDIIEDFEGAGEVREERVEEVVEEEVEKPVEELVEERAEELSEGVEGAVGKVEESVEGVSEEEAEERTEELVDEAEEEVGEEVGEEEVLEEERVEGEVSEETILEALNSEGGEIVVGKFEEIIPESGHVYRRGKELKEGLYLIRVMRREDGKVFEWSSRRDKESKDLSINVPKKFRKELAGKKVKTTIIKYDYSAHFKFEGPNFSFNPREWLIVDGRKIELESVKPLSWSERHGASMVAKLKQRSIDGGEIYLVFYEDGDLNVAFNEEVLREKGGYKATLSVEGNLLMIIKYKDRVAIVPISVQEWKVGKKYYLNILVRGGREISLLKELKKIFGYHNVETLRERI